MDIQQYHDIRATCMAAIKKNHANASIEATSKALISLGCDVAEMSNSQNIEPLLGLLYSITMALEGKLAAINNYGVKPNDNRDSDGQGQPRAGGTDQPDSPARGEATDGPQRGIENRLPSE